MDMANDAGPQDQGSSSFTVHPVARFAGVSKSVRRPKEFTCFSYDENHEFHCDDSSIRWYYPAEVGTDLSAGFESFIKHDDTQDEHLVSLLRAIKDHEEKTGEKIDSQFVTWRGMMTKIMAAPFEWRDGFEMNATLHDGCIFIEENAAYKAASHAKSFQQQRRSRIPPEVMTYWGYKFETLSTLAQPWGATSRTDIENRPHEPVNNKAQYCSVVRTGLGSSSLCLGGEVDAIWDSKPKTPGAPINWVELKTSKTPRSPRDHEVFHEKLMKFWIQSFLLGVPRIVVGFRSPDGILESIEELETERIPQIAAQGERARWNANICVNFAAAFLEWLKETVTDEGIWRIARVAGEEKITVTRIESQGYGEILSEEFLNWRIKMMVNQTAGPVPKET
ncbi:Decapping nuclease rai1 [Ceratocystis fimbriata CBS 114723]|uniref:Decapping nuclease n=1 Tax=Ceratocystis fimbriata CBS 114723 TaxID=1035309 RepID=A0A2C5WZW4_9PEZI|nr:Decapping nuclease rai1 [Ceratocystis fimbriata CBS 114723]